MIRYWESFVLIRQIRVNSRRCKEYRRAEQNSETAHDAVEEEEASSSLSVLLSRSVSVAHTTTTLLASEVLTIVGLTLENGRNEERIKFTTEQT